VHALLHDTGLARYYALRRGPGAPPPELRPDALAWLAQVPATPSGGAARRRTLDVQGIHCAACVWVLQELFRRHAGAISLTINPGVGRAEILWNDDASPLTEWLREGERFGYRFGPPRKDAPRHSRELVVRLAICSAAAMNTMIFSLSFYFGLAPEDGLLPRFFGLLELGLGTVAAWVGGGVFLRSATSALRRGIVHLDLPIALGVVLAWGGSVHQHFARGPQAAYFDSVSVFVTLMLLGRWLQERQLERNRLALLAADDLGGLWTRRVVEGAVQPVAAGVVERGDELCVVPGDLVPVAGLLLERAALIRLDWIDGESVPRPLRAGDAVPAGAFNAGGSPLLLSAAESFAESRLHDLLSRPAPAREAGGRSRFGRSLGTAWALGVIASATAGFLAWLPQGASRALEVTVSILVVTCPCAIGLAMPLAHDLAHGALRRRGVFVRDATFLDRALSVRRVLFDKTGTLTRGGVALGEDARRRLAALPAAERDTLRAMTLCSNHAVARAIVPALGDPAGAPAARGRLPAPDRVREIPGCGLECRVAGITWRLGRRPFALGDASAADDGATWWSRDGLPRLRLVAGEEFRADAAAEVRELAARGLDVRILSGDAPDRVARAASRLSLPPASARGGLSPEEKARIVRDLDRGDTLFVGDGINDGPAFDAAACSGTPAVDHATLPGRADFYFLGGGLAAVRWTLDAARRLRAVTRTNLVVSVAYNLVVLALCFAGLVRPPAAAVLMPLSSLAVVSITAARLSEGRLAWK
jgi:Cu2+-exporting ATPase